ncbi:MAG: fumarylacetoacetate hydrolase, partial [Burkholderiales bacterium]|nr:fumarylacetoacetate hydrolase [Burkholderiales bacterium]
MNLLDHLCADRARARLVGRVFDPGLGGPCVVALRGDEVFDITSRAAPTMRDLIEQGAPAALLDAPGARSLGPVEALLRNSHAAERDPHRPWLLAPLDLQAVKAAGVTFAESLVERVIEEQARGLPDRALAIRAEVTQAIGGALDTLVPGSAQA